MSLVDLATVLGGIGGFVGSIAVLITIVYLARQVAQAKEQLALLGRQTRANHATQVLAPIIYSGELAPIFEKLNLVDFGKFGLSREESIRFGAWFHTWLQTEQGSFYLLPKGANDALLNWMLATPAGAEFWMRNKGIYDADFAEHVEGLRRKLEAAPRTPAEILSGTVDLAR